MHFDYESKTELNNLKFFPPKKQIDLIYIDSCAPRIMCFLPKTISKKEKKIVAPLSEEQSNKKK